MPQRNVATNFTFEQQRAEINLLASDFWTQKGTVDGASTTYLKHDGSNNFTGATLAVPNAFTINSDSGNGTVTISGNLNVSGTTTTVNTTNLEVTDKNILISKGSTTDAQADGAGITIDSATDITWNFVDANDAWVSSIGVESTTFLKATTFLEAARGQFTGATTPTAGSGVEVNAPDANTGQIIAYNRGTDVYNELRVKGTSVGVYTGSTNALVGTFNSTGLTMESGKNITCPGDLDVDGTSYFGANGSITTGANFVLSSNKFRITGSDTVGIECQRAGNATIQCTDTTNSTDLQLRANSDGGLVRTATEKPLIFGTYQNERLRISSSGRVAIGNTTNNASPTALLAVIADDGEAANLYIAKFHNLEATTGESFGVNIQAGSSADDHGLRVKNKANDATQFIVQGDGNVGIGKDDPNWPLTVQRSSGTTTIGCKNTGGNANVYIEASDGNTAKLELVEAGTGSYSLQVGNDNALMFFDDAEERLRITSGGDVSISGDGTVHGVSKLTILPANRTDAFAPEDGDTWHDVVLKQTGDAQTNAVGIAFEISTSGYHKNAGTGIAAVKNGTAGDYGTDLVFITRGQSTAATEKLRITSTAGNVLPGTDNTQDLGSTAKRWANVYTGDLNLCNEGSCNEVDGTSGSWTMQEGDSDLFLINRKSGKKYKFNLTEVS